MDDLIIIGVTGLPSAGKGVFHDITLDYGFKQIVMGDVIRNECRNRGLPITRESSNNVMIALREERGENAIALISIEWVNSAVESNHKFILVDGIRSWAEVKTFRESYPNFKVVAIHASQKTRLLRAMRRRRKDDAFSEEEFLKRDMIEVNIGIGDVIAKSDILVSSESSFEETKNSFNDALNFILNEKKIEIEL